MANNGLEDGSIKREKKLECKNQQDYLKSLPSNVLERLYNHPTICLAVYRYISSYNVGYFVKLYVIENYQNWPDSM